MRPTEVENPEPETNECYHHQTYYSSQHILHNRRPNWNPNQDPTLSARYLLFYRQSRKGLNIADRTCFRFAKEW